MNFRIAGIETCIVDHALREDRIVVSPAGRHDTSRFVNVTLSEADGMVGYGEAAMTLLWSGETAETAQRIIKEIFAPQLIGNSFDHPREVLALLDKAIYGHPFAKSALDTAAWDLWAKMQGVPVTSLFADRQARQWIPTRASVGCYDVEKTLRIATEFWEAGIKTLKFKIGSPGFDDVARLQAVREALGDAPVFTVDANGAYDSLEIAVNAIEALLPFQLNLVEQPTPRERIFLLAQVKKRVPVPIMADECIWRPNDLEEALDCDACDIVSIYPGKNGGFTHALDMAQTVHRAGKVCSIGSNLETDLGQAAMAALASGLQVFPENIACDLPAVLFYEKSPVRQPLQFEAGAIQVPTGNGFGVEPIN